MRFLIACRDPSGNSVHRDRSRRYFHLRNVRDSYDLRGNLIMTFAPRSMHLKSGYVYNGPSLSLFSNAQIYMCVYSSRSFSLSPSFLLSSTPIAAGCPRTFCAITGSSVRKRSLEERSTIPSIFYATLTSRSMRASSSAYNNDPLRARLTLTFRWKDRYCYFHTKNYSVSLCTVYRMLTELSLTTRI